MFRQVADDYMEVPISGQFHCGPDNTSPKRFRYRIELSYPDGALDSRGFLLDNLYFAEYAAKLGTVNYSCERLAAKIGNDLMTAAKRCTSISVRIYPFDSVYVEHVAKRDVQVFLDTEGFIESPGDS